MQNWVNGEKNCRTVQGLIMKGDADVDKLARAFDIVDTAKKKLLVKARDIIRHIKRD